MGPEESYCNFKAMKYLIRSVKYFFYFSILCFAIVVALVFIGAVEGNIDAIFKDGYNSLWKIAVFFAVVAAVYPKLGFISRGIPVDKDWNEIRDTVIEYFKDRRYDVESEDGDTITFRFRTIAGRLSKMYEDRITLTRTPEGYQMEGLRKDVLRLAVGMENQCERL